MVSMMLRVVCAEARPSTRTIRLALGSQSSIVDFTTLDDEREGETLDNL